LDFPFALLTNTFSSAVF